MSIGDFGAELSQSVKEHLEGIERGLAAAKARVADGIAGLVPEAPSAPAQLHEPSEVEPDPRPSRRYNVSFDDIPEPVRNGSDAPAWEEPQ